MALTLEEITREIKQFCSERDWDKFLKPKDLILALVSEIGELAECFRWLSEEELDKILKNHEKKKKIEEEVADILYWLIIISDKLGIDMLKVLENKMEINKKRFPIEESKGVHTNPIDGSKGRR